MFVVTFRTQFDGFLFISPPLRVVEAIVDFNRSGSMSRVPCGTNPEAALCSCDVALRHWNHRYYPCLSIFRGAGPIRSGVWELMWRTRSDARILLVYLILTIRIGGNRCISTHNRHMRGLHSCVATVLLALPGDINMFDSPPYLFQV